MPVTLAHPEGLTVDLYRQVSIAIGLAAAGASFDDVAKLAVCFVDWTPDKMPVFVEGVARATAKPGTASAPPLTGVGVAARTRSRRTPVAAGSCPSAPCSMTQHRAWRYEQTQPGGEFKSRRDRSLWRPVCGSRS